MRNYALDTKLLPKVWITWASTKNGEFNQRYWLNCQTGKKKTTPEPWMHYEDESSIDRFSWRIEDKVLCGIHCRSMHSDKIWVKSGCSVKYAYVKYHADIDRLEVAAVGVDTTRKLEPHPWHFLGDRFFIGKDKSVIDANGQTQTSNFRLYQYHTAWAPRELVHMLIRLTTIKGFVEEFKKFIGEDFFTIGDGSTIAINSTWHLQKWYETSQRARGKGKQGKLTDELTAIELSDVSGLAARYAPITLNARYGKTILTDFVYYEKVNDDWDVLRKFYRKADNTLVEIQRVYLCKNGNVRVASREKGAWVPSKYRCSNTYYSSRYYLANKDEAIAACDRIKYAISQFGEIGVAQLVDFLVASLRFPEIEQIAKLGYLNEMLYIVSSATIKADLRDMFGGYYNEKEKNILRKVGMTKHQFDAYMSSGNSNKKRALTQMRQIFGDNLSYLDNESFDKYFDSQCNVCRYFWRPIVVYADSCHFDPVRFFKNITRLAEKREDVFRIANDTAHSYISLNRGTHPDVDWYFEDVSDLTRTHDALMELQRTQAAERRARWDMSEAERIKKDEERRIKVDKERKTYEYEDDLYIIRLPKDSAEIIKEGNVQHICIGGYTSRHANGDTNLFFLRKKDNADAPFYAIEMGNSKRIIQIHGFGNKWLGNDPDAIPTVVRWLRKNGIACDEKILTCKARGYGRVNDYVAMPVVD